LHKKKKDISTVKQKIKSSLYSLDTLSSIMSERCPTPRLYARTHTSRLQHVLQN